MKFLLDVCSSSRALTQFLREREHDAVSAMQIDARATDVQLMELALKQNRVLLTEDKDFGELVFVHRLPHPTIVRFMQMSVAQQVSAMDDLLNQHVQALENGALIVVTPGRIRIRLHPDMG